MSKEKCEIKGQRIDFCNGMSTMLEPEANAGKGLSQINTMNMKTCEIKTIGVAYIRNKNSKLMLNKCPWCGESIKNW